jgi:hypothetical protein
MKDMKDVLCLTSNLGMNKIHLFIWENLPFLSVLVYFPLVACNIANDSLLA